MVCAGAGSLVLSLLAEPELSRLSCVVAVRRSERGKESKNLCAGRMFGVDAPEGSGVPGASVEVGGGKLNHCRDVFWQPT